MKFCGSRTGIPLGEVWERVAAERLDALPLTGVEELVLYTTSIHT